MFRRGWIVFRILGAVLLVILVLAGVGLAYRAGFTQGVAQAAILARGDGLQAVPAYPFYPGFWGPHFGFFPVFPLFGFFLFGLFFLFALRLLFRPWHWGYAGRWPRHEHEWGTPPWMKDRPEHESGPEAKPETPPGEAGKEQG